MKWPLSSVNRKNHHKLFLSLNFNTGYRGRASDLTVPGLGHSVIRGLVTNRSMVRRESCRLLAWIKIYKYNVNRGISQIIRTQECSKTPPLYPVWISCFCRWKLTKSVSSAWLPLRRFRCFCQGLVASGDAKHPWLKQMNILLTYMFCHHPPNKTCQFPCYCSCCYISVNAFI